MKTEVLSRFDMTWMPTVAFFLFFSVFFYVLFFVWRPKSASYLKHMAELPLENSAEQKGDSHERTK